MWRSRQWLYSREAIVPAVLTLIGLGVRFVARAGVGDIRPVLGVGAMGFSPRAGWSSLLCLVFAMSSRRTTYETIWAIHRLLGTLAVPLLYAALSQRFSKRSIAVAGAAALAVLPLAARFSATDTPYVPLCTAFLASIVALTHFRQTGSRSALAIGLVLLTASLHLRPDGPWLTVPALMLVLTVAPTQSGRAFSLNDRDRRDPVLGPQCRAVALGPRRPQSGRGWQCACVHANELRAVRHALRESVGRSRWMSPWPLSLLVGAGGLIALTMGRSGVGWVLATLIAMPLNFPAPAQYANARYHLPAVYLACGLGGIAAAQLAEWGARRYASRLDPSLLAASLVFVAAIPRLDLLRRTWTLGDEFEFYRSGLQRLDPACKVVALLNGNDAGFVPTSDPNCAYRPADISEFLASPPTFARDVCGVLPRSQLLVRRCRWFAGSCPVRRERRVPRN